MCCVVHAACANAYGAGASAVRVCQGGCKHEFPAVENRLHQVSSWSNGLLQHSLLHVGSDANSMCFSACMFIDFKGLIQSPDLHSFLYLANFLCCEVCHVRLQENSSVISEGVSLSQWPM